MEIVAVSEGRLDRTKHSYSYPLHSISYCLAAFGINNLDQVDMICIDAHDENWPELNSQFGLKKARNGYINLRGANWRNSYLIEQSLYVGTTPIVYTNHVDCHAANAFYLSGFDTSAVLVMEGGQGIYNGNGTEISVIDRAGYGARLINNGKLSNAINTAQVNPSVFFDHITKLIGFDNFSCGKTMALAAFGEEFQRQELMPIPSKKINDFLIDYSLVSSWVSKNIEKFDPTTHPNGPDGLVDKHWVNIARQTQESLYEDMLYLSDLAQRKTGASRICLSGGTALSCVTNRRIIDSKKFKDVFIQPAASDEGNPLGAALIGYYRCGGQVRPPAMKHTYFGRKYNDKDIPSIAARWGFTVHPFNVNEAATLLTEGKVIGRSVGQSEYGPRALGNRSILADPRNPNMMDYINREIKQREGFRPFAPSILAESVTEYFEQNFETPFMVVASQVKKNKRKIIPSVTHIDGSARVQTVRKEQNPGYYQLLKAFEKVSGVPVLLNTSFNDNEEPIVETPEDALRSFLATGLDYLILENWLIKRPENSLAIEGELSKSITNSKKEEYQSLIKRFCDLNRYNAVNLSLLKT
jgi:carbamoyltransferase